MYPLGTPFCSQALTEAPTPKFRSHNSRPQINYNIIRQELRYFVNKANKLHASYIFSNFFLSSLIWWCGGSRQLQANTNSVVPHHTTRIEIGIKIARSLISLGIFILRYWKWLGDVMRMEFWSRHIIDVLVVWHRPFLTPRSSVYWHFVSLRQGKFKSDCPQRPWPVHHESHVVGRRERPVIDYHRECTNEK